MEPINTEVPQVQRHRRQGQKKCADQERARRPIDAVGRNAKNHLALLSELVTRNASRVTSVQWATENYVFFCPGVDAAAMRAVELLRFHFGRRPELFFYGASGIGQF